MTGGLALLLATLLAIEIAWASRVMASFAALSAGGRRAARIVLRRKVSEWAKERATGLMARRLLGLSLRSGGLLLLVAAPFLVAGWANGLRPFGLARAYRDGPARGVLLVASLAYVALRRRSRKATERKAPVAPHHKAPVAPQRKPPRARRGGGAERLWQRIALGHPAVVSLSFDLERARFQPWRDAAGDAATHAPIFIAGLARAGTTILTRLLHEEHGLASATYRDLPFPLAPNLWGTLSAHLGRHVERHERGHGDRLHHDLDSAEALEEVFWRHHEATRYLTREGLAPTPPAPETIAAFRDYVGLVRRRHGGARYLAKNNANVLRLPALVEAFPRALLLHPFREPVQQAQSLLRQHRLALALAAKDPFRGAFMRWLGHHEFGLHQAPFLFPGHPGVDDDRDGIDYWLRLWISVHAALLAQTEPVRRRQFFVDYDALCAAPAGHAAPLGQALGLAMPLATQGLAAAPHRVTEAADPHLVARAAVVHAQLRGRCLDLADRAA